MLRRRCGSVIIIIVVVMGGAMIIPALITMLMNNFGLCGEAESLSGYMVELDNGEKLDMEEFIPLAVMSQMEKNGGKSALNNTIDEAVKAQIVINRTKIMKNMNNGMVKANELNIEYESDECIKNKKGSSYDKYIQI